MEQNFEQALAQLKVNELTELNLSYKYLTEAQVIRLAEVFKYNQSLTTLNLKSNQLGISLGTSMLSEALKVNQTLTILDLGSSRLRAVGIKKVSEALRVNQMLISLALNGNQLGTDGLKNSVKP